MNTTIVLAPDTIFGADAFRDAFGIIMETPYNEGEVWKSPVYELCRLWWSYAKSKH